MTQAPRAFDISQEDDGADSAPLAKIVEQEDPFAAESPADMLPFQIAVAEKRGVLLPFALSMFGAFLLMAMGNWASGVIADLMNRQPWLGYTGLVFLALAISAALIWVVRELLAMRHLARIDALRRRGYEAHEARDSGAARNAIQELSALYASDPSQSRARAEIDAAFSEIIDADDRIAMAERLLLRPLDQRARTMISDSAKRVSVVTAVSPRALVDLMFVGAETLRLIRKLAMLYGGRPGFFGSVRLMRAVFAQFLVTGGLAVGDDLAGQFLGHGVAARLSAKLGEGVLNGLLTARVGLAAIDACRPLAFISEPRPKVREVAGALLDNIGKNPFA